MATLLEDARVLARAILSDWHESNGHDSYSGPWQQCRYCDSTSPYYNRGDTEESLAAQIVHDLTCPVLVASDVLTGSEVQS